MTRLRRWALSWLCAALALVLGIVNPVVAAPNAALVMDARTGQVLYSDNADTRVHPASLTKMMTLYIAFQAIERGDIRLDTEITVTKVAAQQPPSRLGLREGQKIQLQHLIRAAAIKSANDAATAIGVGIAGSEAAYAEQMTATARAMGMNNTRFRNMHGLTTEGHYSTARDMSILGRHLIYDFPQYYNIFSRRTADAGIAQVRTTNARFLDNYEGADGIKTGYTQAAGYNLTASAERGNVRIITTVLGASSGADRHEKITRLMNMGFDRAPSRARVSRPDAVAYQGQRRSTPSTSSPRPLGAPDAAPAPGAIANEFDMNALIAAVSSNTASLPEPQSTDNPVNASGAVGTALRPASRPAGAAPTTTAGAVQLALEAAPASPKETAPIVLADLPPMTVPRPSARPGSLASGTVGAITFAQSAPPPAAFGATAAQPETLALLNPDAAPESPPARSGGAIIMTAADIAPSATQSSEVEVVTRLSTSGSSGYGINIGRFNSTYAAERELMRVAMMETSVLSDSRRTVLQTPRGYDATFMGLNRDNAELACQRLQARGQMCFMIGS